MKQLDNSQLNALKGGVNKRDKAHGRIYKVPTTTSTPK